MFRKTLLVSGLLALILLAGSPAMAAIANYLAPNTIFNVGPLPPVHCWADAHYAAPNDYGAWIVGGGGAIDGNASFIWLRQLGQWAQTTLTCASTDVVVGFGSDTNDGLTEIVIDNVTVAVVDTYSSPGVYWYIVTQNLPLQLHTIYVLDTGETEQVLPHPNFDDDVSLDGAGIQGAVVTETTTWGRIKALYRQ